MSILLENGLPDEYEGIPLLPDFRNMIRVDIIMRDETVPDALKGALILKQLYGDALPEDIHKALDGLQWFMSCGNAGSGGTASQSNHKRGFDFEQDANRIYASFRAAYNISLADIEFLHWWEFVALFEGLPSDSPIMQAIYYRTADVSKLSKHQKAHAQKMKRFYALKGPERAPMTVEEAEKQAKDRLMAQYQEAQRALVEKQKRSNST